MDPDANLKEQLQLSEKLQRALVPHEADGVRLAELVSALNGWIRAGGFL